MTERRPATFSDRLLNWWDKHGRKDLPWQHPRTHYRVWISEIMLQQTQVATVIPYFERWMERFPDLPTLAAASQDDVLALWSGLGYYARARNLHQAARNCVRDHDGELPAAAEQLVTLPGIGESTANAIVSQATDRPAAVLDGNVRRLLARHAAIEGWTGGSAILKELWKEARRRLPRQRGADYTQAIMDMGALVCTRSRPACSECPVRSDCRALALGQVAALPSPRPAGKVKEATLHMLILRNREKKVLLQKRPPSGIWGGLWCLPCGESIEEIQSALGLAGSESQMVKAFDHRLSHLKLRIIPTIATVADARQVKCGDQAGWYEPAQAKSLGLPRPITTLLGQLETGEFE